MHRGENGPPCSPPFWVDTHALARVCTSQSASPTVLVSCLVVSTPAVSRWRASVPSARNYIQMFCPRPAERSSSPAAAMDQMLQSLSFSSVSWAVHAVRKENLTAAPFVPKRKRSEDASFRVGEGWLSPVNPVNTL